MKKLLFIFLGFLSFSLGTVGIFLPILPTVPFYLLTAYLWFNSSEKLHHYLVNSPYYKQYIQQDIIERKATPKKLIKMLIVLFIILLVPFIFINSLHVRIILGLVFLAHILGIYIYFFRKK